MSGVWVQSVFIHLVVISAILIASMVQNTKEKPEKIEKQSFEIIEIEKEKPAPIKIEPKEISIAQKKPKPEALTPVTKPVKKVFGVSKDTLTSNDTNAVVVKQGNTITKEVDDEVLENDDPLPIPEPAYLVSQMPVLQKEKKPDYPAEARKKSIEGKVVLNVLIDNSGLVRSVAIVEDPGYGMGQKAKEAMFEYVFQPARISGKAVAVEVRYVVTFELL